MRREKLFIASSYCDPSLNLKYSSFLRMFQDIGDRNSHDIGAGKEETMNKGMLWVLLRTYVEFDELPKYRDEVDFYTYPNKTKGKAFFYRQAGMLNKEGKSLVRLSALWCLIDKKERKIVLNPGLPLVEESYDYDIALPEKIKKQPTSYIESRVARYSDGDLNGHLNNTKYVDWILDTREAEYYKTHELKSLLINYESEVKLGDKLDIYANEDLTYFEGKVGDRVSFTAEISFK